MPPAPAVGAEIPGRADPQQVLHAPVVDPLGQAVQEPATGEIFQP
jgi:hypothetical protein